MGATNAAREIHFRLGHYPESAAHEKEAPGIEQTDLVSLVKYEERAEAGASLGEVHQQFQTHQQDFCAVMEAGKVAGLCSRSHLGFLMGHRYGFAIYSKEPVREHLVERPILLRRGTPVRQTLESALGQQGKAFNDDVILLGAEDQYLGVQSAVVALDLNSASLRACGMVSITMRHDRSRRRIQVAWK